MMRPPNVGNEVRGSVTNAVQALSYAQARARKNLSSHQIATIDRALAASRDAEAVLRAATQAGA